MPCFRTSYATLQSVLRHRCGVAVVVSDKPFTGQEVIGTQTHGVGFLAVCASAVRLLLLGFPALARHYRHDRGMDVRQMRGYNRICVNPAFEMSKKSKMLTVGTHEYFKPRKDGTTHFEITSEIIRHHAEMEKHQFDGITEEDRKQVWGMFADNDQQVNGESLFLQYYNQVIHFSGEHRMDDRVIEDVLVPLIYRCVAK